ncbi:family 1 encapsulin nanocompartment shell protein [Lachnospiraceae bacterium 54-53]
MSYLSRENSNLPTELWEQIDSAVVNTARNILISRRFLHIFGPLGIGTESIHIDDSESLDEVSEDGFIITKGRKYVEIPIIYDDFTIFTKDLENSWKFGYPIDLSKAASAAENCSRKEDRLVFFGNPANGYDGLLTAPGTNKIKRSDWSSGENAFSDIVAAFEIFTKEGIFGTYALVLSPDLYTQLQRIQPGTGLLEIDRISKLLNGNVFCSSVLGTGKAVLVCPEARNMDLVIGQDQATAYLEQKDLNHSFRVLESVLLRIKRKQAITVFE